MRQNITLTIASLATLVLFSLHLTQDVLHDKAGLDVQGTVICLVIMLVLLYGTVELAGRWLGYIVMFLGGIASAYMPFLHGLGPSSTRWGFLFVWTMLAMGVSGTFAAILSLRALWRVARSARS